MFGGKKHKRLVPFSTHRSSLIIGFGRIFPLNSAGFFLQNKGFICTYIQFIHATRLSRKTVRKSTEKLCHVGSNVCCTHTIITLTFSLVCHVSDVTSKLLEMSCAGSNGFCIDSLLNILKSHLWSFIKPCKHIPFFKTNTYNNKLRARCQYYWSYFPL